MSVVSEGSLLGRRALLGGGVAAGVLGLAGCDVVKALRRTNVPDRFAAPTSAEVDDDVHFLSRLTMGPRPGDLERVRAMGREAWLDEQLSSEIDPGLAWRVRADDADVVRMSPDLLYEIAPEHIEAQLTLHAIASAVFSARQLHEVMVEVMSDHVHVALAKDDCRHLLPADRRDVVRAHALGSFRALLRASVLSPAMLVYLDGRENSVEGGGAPNENHARELLELHTLGVHGGYTQADVKETARCLTGWVVEEKWRPGNVAFAPARHDDGEKVVLGRTIAAGGGAGDVDALLDVLMEHPSTARHVGRTVAAALVADEPPRQAVEAAAGAFTRTGGDLAAVVRAVVKTDAFFDAKREKVKRPLRFVASTLRALGVTAEVDARTVDWLTRMGHRPFGWPTPDGYPRDGLAYVATLMARFQYVNALFEGGLKRTEVPAEALARAVDAPDAKSGLLAHLFGRRANDLELEALAGGDRSHAAVLAMGLASPAFQRF